MKSRLLTSYLFAILLTGSSIFLVQETSCQVRVSKISSADMLGGKKGVVYNLPRSVFDVEISVTRTQQFPGPLAEYAREFLGVDEVVGKSQIEYRIDHVAMTCRNEPDPHQAYVIEKEEKAQGETWVSFGPSGQDLVMESFQKDIGPQGFSKWDDELYRKIEPAGLYAHYSASATREVIDTIIRKVSIDTLTIEEQSLKRSLVPYPDREKAQEATDRINRIDSDIYNLLIGYQETAYSKDALEFMYNKLMQERKEYLALFTGFTVQESLAFHYTVVPDPARDSQEYPVAGFSSNSGLVDAGDQNSIELVIFKADNVPVADASLEQAQKGVVYRVPAVLTAKLQYKGKEMASGNYKLMQFGALLSLPAEFRKVELDLSTGMIRTVVIE